MSRFHSPTARFAFQRSLGATASNLPLWQSHCRCSAVSRLHCPAASFAFQKSQCSTAPCAMSRFHSPTARFAFQRSPGTTSCVTVPLFHCILCGLGPLSGAHFKCSIVRGPFGPRSIVRGVSQCTLCGLKVCLWLRGGCLRGLPGDCLHGLLRALRGHCFHGPHGSSKGSFTAKKWFGHRAGRSSWWLSWWLHKPLAEKRRAS